MADIVKKEKEPVPTTVEGLRDALFDEINLLRAGKTTPQKARAISHLAAQVVQSLQVQIQYQKLMAQMGSNKPIQIGSPK